MTAADAQEFLAEFVSQLLHADVLITEQADRIDALEAEVERQRAAPADDTGGRMSGHPDIELAIPGDTPVTDPEPDQVPLLQARPAPEAVGEDTGPDGSPVCQAGPVPQDDAGFCPNCGAPIEVGGWVIVIHPPKNGAVLTDDGSCQDCGMPFWTDGPVETVH